MLKKCRIVKTLKFMILIEFESTFCKFFALMSFGNIPKKVMNTDKLNLRVFSYKFIVKNRLSNIIWYENI